MPQEEEEGKRKALVCSKEGERTGSFLLRVLKAGSLGKFL